MTMSGSGTFANTTASSVKTISSLPVGRTILLSIFPTNFNQFQISANTDKRRLLDVIQWGETVWSSMDNAFSGCSNLNISATDAPNLASVTSMNKMFFLCSKLNGPANIGSWNTSTVLNMRDLFAGCSIFNQPIANWITDNVTTFSNMFNSASKFNQPLDSWNISKAIEMNGMFNSASAFDQNLGSWASKFNPNVNLSFFLDNTGMAVSNYDATLQAFNSSSAPNGRSMGGTNLRYCNSALARANLVKPISQGGKGWTITGDISNLPVISNQPISVSTVDGASATFSAQATNVTSYQWQVKIGTGEFVNIPDATLITYSIPSTTLSQNGNQYRVIVSNGTCQSSSDVATLTVTSVAPFITSFSPESGMPGSTVSITGVNFNTIADRNVVYFGAVKAKILDASATRLSVMVPFGATLENISVTNLDRRLTGYTTKPFRLTSIGSFSFIPQQSLSNPNDIRAGKSLVGDIDGDGKTDIITSNTITDGFSIYRNLTSGTETTFADGLQFGSGLFYGPVLLNDLDSDGKLDIIRYSGDKVSIFKNTSVPNNVSISEEKVLNLLEPQSDLLIGDFNSDGKPDLLGINGDVGRVMFYKNISQGEQIQFETYPQPFRFPNLGFSPFPDFNRFLTRDINGDAKIDILVLDANSGRLHTFMNNSAGNRIDFLESRLYLIPEAMSFVSGFSVEDFNNDGMYDIAITGNGQLYVDYDFSSESPSLSSRKYYPTELYARPAAVNDIDGDGKLDFIVPNTFSSTLTLINSNSEITTSLNPGFRPESVVIGDLNNDGKYDLVSTNVVISNTVGSAISFITQESCDFKGPNGLGQNALNFDGINDYVEISNCAAQPLPLSDAITIEYWYKGTAMQSAVRFQHLDANANDKYIVMGWQNRVHILSNDGGVDNGLPIGLNAQDGAWHHVAMTWERNKVNGFKSYLDGQLVAQRNSSDIPIPSIPTGWYLGAFGANSEFMNGSLENVRVWNVARTASQILEGITRTEPEEKTGLLMYYKFNEGIKNGNNTQLTQIENFVSTSSFTGYLRNFTLNGGISNFISGRPNFPLLIEPPQKVVCSPSTLEFSASGCDGTITWSYNNHTGSTLSISEVGIYSVSAKCTVDGLTSAPSLPVTGLEIKASPSATISYANTPFNITNGVASVSLTGTTGGVFTSTPAGLSINSTTGDINLGISTAGTYTVKYTISASGGCSLTATTEVTVKPTFVEPTITSFTPASGSVGTLVTITGTNLDSPTALNIGGVSAVKVSNNGTTLVAMVMPGATTGTVLVSTAGGTATSGSNFKVTPTSLPNTQQGDKLVGTGGIVNAQQGASVAISADGNTAIVGGYLDNFNEGAAWVYTRSDGVWRQQGSKLIGATGLGFSVAISADGNTAMVGGIFDDNNTGAALIYTRSGEVWTQQGSKLIGIGAVGNARQGYSVALSADGNTAISGGIFDNNNTGAAWVFTRNGGVWTQKGSKLVGTGNVGESLQGTSISLSADGRTAMVGGYRDNGGQGAVWVYTLIGNEWKQQGNKLVGASAVGNARQGKSVSLSADGNTAIIGGDEDNTGQGAAWIFTRNDGIWTQQGGKLVLNSSERPVSQGCSVSLSADGNTAVLGANRAGFNRVFTGAAYIYTRSEGVWTQQKNKLVGTGAAGIAAQGSSVAVSANGNTAFLGGPFDNNSKGAAWVFIASPTITLDGTLTAFSTCLGSASAAQSFAINGVNLTNKLVITAPTGFEVSTSLSSGYAGSVDLMPLSGAISTTTIYIRLATNAIGSLSSNLTCTSEGATTQNITLSGTVNDLATVSITGTANLTCTATSVNRIASGGISYSWAGPNSFTTNTAEATITTAGTYTVTVTGVSGCTATATTVVTLDTSIDRPTITTFSTVNGTGGTVVCTPNDLTLTATCTTGRVVWSNNTTGTSLTLSAVGTYSITAKCVLNGCESMVSNVVSLEIKALPNVTATNTGPYNIGQTISLFGSGGETYSWTGPNNFSSTLSTPTILNALSVNGGIYTLTVIGGNGCSAQATTNVVVNGVDLCDPDRIVDYLYVKAGNPHQPLFNLTDGMIINQIPEQVSILVTPSLCPSVTIESFEMNIQGPELNWNILDNVAPHALFDNAGTDILGRNFKPGNYTLTVTGYAQDNKGGGITYGPKIIRFTVVGNLAIINAPTLSKTSICAGSTFDVSFNTSVIFNTGNEFRVELSDSSGSFAAPVLIGTTNRVGTLGCIIPQNTLEGTRYLIRVSSSNQVLFSNPAMSQVTIHPFKYNLVSPTNNLSGTKTKKAVTSISASNKVTSPATVTYRAGRTILLTPGFESSAVFKAEIQGCDN